MTPRESNICFAAREAVRSKPQRLKDVTSFVNGFFPQERLGNPVTEAGVASVVGKYGRAKLKQFVRDGEPWLVSLEHPRPE